MMIKTVKTFLTALFMGLSCMAIGQMKQANDMFEHHHYEEAIGIYNKIIRKDLDNVEAITNLAVCYWRTDQHNLAEYWFTRAALMNTDPNVKLWYSMVLMSNEKYTSAVEWLQRYMDATTDEAKLQNARQLADYCTALIEGYIPETDCEVTAVSFNSEELDFAPLVHEGRLIFVTNREGVSEKIGVRDPWTSGRFTDVFVTERTGADSYAEPMPLDPVLQGYFHDGPLCISKDGQELYMTRSDVDERNRRYDQSRNTRVKIVRFVRNENGVWAKGEALPFYSSNYNTAHPALSADGKTLIFASDMEGGFGGMDLYKVVRDEDKVWGEPTNLGALINTAGNEIFPSFGPDKALYFASDLQVGFGGLDIYKSKKTDRGSFGAPVNLGMPINGPKDDFAISFEKDRYSGYFTSNRAGNGGDDIYSFQFQSGIVIEGIVVTCKNGTPIPGAQIQLTGEPEYADQTVASSEGKFRLLVPAGGRFDLTARHPDYIVDQTCSGFEQVSTATLLPGDKVKVTLAMSGNVYGVVSNRYACGTITHGRYGYPLQDVELAFVSGCEADTLYVTTNAEGGFFVPTETDCEYGVLAQAEGFQTVQHTFNTVSYTGGCQVIDLSMTEDGTVAYQAPPLPAQEEEESIAEIPGAEIREEAIQPSAQPRLAERPVVLKRGQVLDLYHVYFSWDSDRLDENAIEDLHTLVQILKENPGMTGEIMAHTDVSGDYHYNIDLSRRRARSVQRWLLAQGIDADRLMANGYGSTIPKVRCTGAHPCSPEDHARNRRVEFRIMDDGQQIDVLSRERSLHTALRQ